MAILGNCSSCKPILHKLLQVNLTTLTVCGEQREWPLKIKLALLDLPSQSAKTVTHCGGIVSVVTKVAAPSVVIPNLLTLWQHPL